MECCGKAVEMIKMTVDGVHQGQCKECEQYYQTYNDGVYKYVPSTDGWECNKCGTEIQGRTVTHPVHDGPFPLSGSGRVKTTIVPYCPECEQVPSSQGSFVSEE